MAGIKLSAKAQEEYEYLEHVIKQVEHLLGETEKYAGANNKNAADQSLMTITRALGHLRQNAMMKNLGFVADSAGQLGVSAGRGSQMQRSRTLREGLAALKQLVERTMKATIEVDKREKEQRERELAAENATKTEVKP